LLPSFASRTVMDLEDNYSTLLTLIELADLSATLRGGAWTLFAPNNAAFGKLDQATFDVLTSTAGKDDLIKILTYHAVPQVLTSEYLRNGAPLATAEGGMVIISVVNRLVNSPQREGGVVVTRVVNSRQVMVDDANVVSTDILALNGVTHGIDSVLVPPVNIVEAPTPTSAAPKSASPTLSLTSATGVLGSSLLGLFVMALTAAW
jgi:uncharacterized surface protein with fasciclin (FAS1) repeats